MERDEQMVLSESQNPAAEISEPSKVSAGASGQEQAGTEQNTNEKKSRETAQNLYLGVVGGGYNDPVPTDTFSVVVPPTSPLRHDKHYTSRWVIVHVETKIWDAEERGSKVSYSTLGVVEDVEVLPGAAYEDSRQMAHSDYYSNATFSDYFTTTQEDAIRLKVRAIGHLMDDRKDLYGPVRPPERESSVTVATPDLVRVAILKPMPEIVSSFRIGAYATLDGLYRPFTSISLPKHQAFLHGAIFAASGWGKTVAMKHLLREFHRLDESPSILVFNVKGREFYDLNQPVSQIEIEKVFSRYPDTKQVWENMQLRPEGLDQSRLSFYPVAYDEQRSGSRYTLKLADIEPDEQGAEFIRFVAQPFDLPEASLNYLCDIVAFFKAHFTERAQSIASHPKARPKAIVRQKNSSSEESLPDYKDTFASLFEILNQLQAKGSSVVKCSDCGQPLQINERSLNAIVRVVSELRRLQIFDGQESFETKNLMRSGHVSVVDVSGLESVIAKRIVITYLLKQVFSRANRIYLGHEDDPYYKGVVIFLDEAWRFFEDAKILGQLETISRMGRSLRVGLWLADQSIPTGEREWHVLNNMRTRILGSITAEPSAIRKVMPLSESMMSALANLRRGMGIFYNQEYSRIPVPVIIPPCTCYHEGD